ncbi:MAG: S41 family peptidase [Kiritimatiellae bacterium]|nr:S41 family peptidase [Kiritimatiellia bacterium]
MQRIFHSGFRRQITLALAGGLLAGWPAFSGEPQEDGRTQAYEKMALYARVLEQVRESYVEEDKLTYQDLVYGSLKGMLSSLDEYSQFLLPDEYDAMVDDTNGRFGGIGVVIGLKDGQLTVIAPMEDTPGFLAGLLPGDRFIEIDGESTEQMDFSDSVKRMRGSPGTKIALKIYRPKTREVKEMEITRANIEVPSVKDAELIEEGIGYLRLTQFDEMTGPVLRKTLKELRSEGMQALIIDLRNNPGGLLSSAVEVCDLFMKRDMEIVSTRGRDGTATQTFLARSGQDVQEYPMILLVNGGSASASEIFGGAMQDHQRAILVGERTYGKGSVQSVIKMDDGSAVRVTTAYYYTPKERLIHKKGIEPDIVVPMAPEEWGRILLARSRPKLAEAEEWEKELKNTEDIQLKRAVDILKGITIFQAQSGEPGVVVTRGP